MSQLNPKKPSQERLDYINEHLSYNPHSGEITWEKRTKNKIKVGDIAGSLNSDGYLHISIKRKLLKAHHIAWYLHTGQWPSTQIDHINRSRSDNRIENLRLSSQSQNCANVSERKDNTSGFRGVTWNKRERKFRAQIAINKKKHQIGTRKTAEEAAQIYNEFVIERNLEGFYPLNVIPQPNPN